MKRFILASSALLLLTGLLVTITAACGEDKEVRVVETVLVEKEVVKEVEGGGDGDAAVERPTG